MSAMHGSFPQRRPRRLRHGALLREVVADVRLHPDQLILPLFVGHLDSPRPVSSMPGVEQLPVAAAVQKIRDLRSAGLKQFILFGITPADHKDPAGSYARDEHAPVNQTLRLVREAGLDVLMYSDLCFCEYTSHGHCGQLCQHDSAWVVDNDRTLKLLGETAVTQARSGASIVAPSGMMDGQVAAIRQALDHAGFEHVAILSYSVKYASNFYGPFREAGEGGMKFGDRRGYQMDFRRSDEWKLELEADLAQGADMVMIKPAATYLDVIAKVRASCSVPVAAYHVSGEYSMLHAAAEKGWVDLRAAALETTLAIRRAGADLILTYFAPDLLRWL